MAFDLNRAWQNIVRPGSHLSATVPESVPADDRRAAAVRGLCSYVANVAQRAGVALQEISLGEPVVTVTDGGTTFDFPVEVTLLEGAREAA